MKTDALILAIPASKLAAVKVVATLRYDQLHTLRRTYELKSDPAQGFLNAHAEMTPLTSIDPVFRFFSSLSGKGFALSLQMFSF